MIFLRVLLVMVILGWGFIRLADIALPLLAPDVRIFLPIVEVISFTILVGILMGTSFSRRCIRCNKEISEGH